MRLTIIGISAAVLAACGQQAAQNQATTPEPAAPLNDNLPVSEANAAAPAAAAKPPPICEHKGPIDTKIVEGGGQVVEH